MSDPVRWGVLGAAQIALLKVIPAMQRGSSTKILAIASRDIQTARAAAARLDIPRAYGSYEELLADRDIEAIYNPLPNHLHVPWSIRAAEAGKHVLCEKPVSMDAAECLTLIAARDRTRVRIGEAFMVHTHPQWIRARSLVRSGAIGKLQTMSTVFSYFNRDPQNVRNIAEYGGGGLLDIGCYAVHTSRFIFGEESVRVSGVLEYDPDFHVDRLASGFLEFPSGHAVFTCGTQIVPYQRTLIFGAAGSIEIEIPFNAPPDRPCRLFVNDQLEEIPTCDQYTIQGDAFSRAIRENQEVPVPLEDSLANMRVLDALKRPL
jgi:predicted dehydrogenase